MLKEQIECNLIKVLSINELNRIKDMNYDFILTFSDRIQDIVSSLGYSSIKLNYFIEDEDIKILLNHGFSRHHQHIITSDFADLIQNKDKNSIEILLKKTYPELFI